MGSAIPGEAKYYERLDEFVDLCRDCVSAGQPYVAVMLCHELYRFLYPVEPFAGFEQHNPVEFSVAHIDRLVATGRALRDSVTPYTFRPANAPPPESEALEKTTSDLYSTLWTGFTQEELVRESEDLVSRRLPPETVDDHVAGKRVLDMGCGSGRYAIALSQLGAASVDAVDVQEKAFAAARAWSEAQGLAVRFHEGNVHDLPFEDGAFDFVFCNGVLHHTSSVSAGVREFCRVMHPEGAGFLYLYGAGGIFWNTRTAMRRVFADVPLEYTRSVLRMMGMPSKRFIFCDTWYVPIETLTSTADVEKMLGGHGLEYKKIRGHNPFDLDREDLVRVPGAQAMWGDGEHRYLVRASAPAEVAAC